MSKFARTTTKSKRKYIIPGRDGWTATEKIAIETMIEKANEKPNRIKFKICENGLKQDGTKIKYPIEITSFVKEAEKIEVALKGIADIFKGAKNEHKGSIREISDKNSDKREKRFTRMDRG